MERTKFVGGKAIEYEFKDKNEEKIRKQSQEIFAKRVAGTLDYDKFQKAINLARIHYLKMHGLERSFEDPNANPKSDVEIRGGRSDDIKVKLTKNPSNQITSGSTGIFVEVESEKAFQNATLCFKLDKETIRNLHTGTIIMAKWNEIDKRFKIIPQSGYNECFNYAFANITRPGIYSAIGLPRDTKLLASLYIANLIKDLGNIDFESKDLKKISLALSHNTELQKMIEHPSDRGVEYDLMNIFSFSFRHGILS